MAASGIAKFRIVNSDGETVYSDTISVNKEEFREYILTLTGQTFLAYAWEIPLAKIKKSFSSKGTAYLKFFSDSFEFEELTDPMFGLPTYSEQELDQINEEDFQRSAILVNNKISRGSFEVTLVRAGFFKPRSYWGEGEEYFRVDLEVKNIGQEAEYFLPSGIVLLDSQGNQYEREYGGTLDIFSKIYPGAKKSGYLLFEAIPKDVPSVKLVFELGHDSHYNPYTFKYLVELLPPIKE